MSGFLLLLLALASAATAQMQPHVRYEGKLLPIAACTETKFFVLDQGKKRESHSRSIEVRPAAAFGSGSVQISNVQADLDPLKNASIEERAKPSSIRFRYEADVTSPGNLTDCYAVLTFVANGSVGTDVIPLGRLAPEKARRVKVTLVSRVEAVGRLHIFARTEEIKSNQIAEAYDVRQYFAGLVQGARGVSAVALCRSEDRFPHVLSNNGNLLATTRQRDTHHSLIVYDLAAMEVRRDLKIGEKGESAWDLTWVSEHELAYLANDPDEFWKSNLMLFDIATGNTQKLKQRVDNIRGTLKSQPDILIIQRNDWTEAWTAKFDVRQRRMLNENNLEEGWTYFDDNGDERVRVELNGDTRKMLYRPTPKIWWKHLDHEIKQPGLKFDYRAKDLLDRVVEFHSIAPDGDTLYVSSRLNSDRFELAAFSFTKGEIVHTVARHPRFDLTTGYDGFARLLFRKNTSELIGIIHDAEKPRIVWLDEGFAAVQKVMDHTFPEHVNMPVDWSTTGNTFIYFSASDTDPGTYYVFRPFESKLIPLLVQGESFKDQPLGRTVPIQFKARDGATIYGYVTSPPEPGNQPAPLIVNIHGGPMARDSWGFDATNQFFTTRGYVVLQVNYRGSSGYGAAYQKAGLHARLDTVVLDDVADGVQHLIASGAVDHNRIAVMGASFGGWATYLSLIKYPELYRAGIAISAISHWRKTLKDDKHRFYNLSAYGFWKALLDREDFDAVEKYIDPFLRASELKQPIYIMHGEFDNIVHATEARLMLNELKKTNPHVEAMSFPTASHTYWPYAARVSRLNEIETFLRRHLPPPAPNATDTPATPSQ